MLRLVEQERDENGDPIYEIVEEEGEKHLMYAKCKTYEGDYKDGERTGQGTLTWPDGKKYVGDFCRRYFHNPNMLETYGAGTLTWPKDADGNKTEYVGTFVESRMEGEGKLTVTKADGSTECYEGDFENNKKHGKGTVTFSDRPAEDYTATFEKGRMVGEKEYKAPEPAAEASPGAG